MTSPGRRKAMLPRAQKNEKYKHISLEMETSTHFPLLIKLVQMTDGPILELGSGVFSTPLLHCLDLAKKFRTPWHEVAHKPRVRAEDITEHFSIVFIDHSPKKPRTRGDDALLFKDKADYVVLHDAGVKGKAKYGYDQLYPQFKYRYDWTGCMPHTTVLSNFKPLDGIYV